MKTSPPDLRETPRVPDEGWGPTVHGRGRRRRWPIVLVLALVLPLLYGAVLASRMTTSMGRTDVTRLAGESGPPLHVLVTGSDSRAGLTPEERNELTTGSAGGERTDSIFLLTTQGNRAGILAFPRDLYVTRCDGSSGRINAALSIGGVDCLVDTVQSLSGIGIDHYVAVSFGGFRDIVDAVGGVDLCLDKPIKDAKAGLDLPQGCQSLNGPQALGFVRTRSLDSDLERINRQQQFLGALAKKIATPATVLNPPRAYQMTGALGNALTADQDLGITDLARLGLAGRALAGGAAVSATVPASGARIGGASVLQIDESAAESLFASFRDGSILDQAKTGVTPAETKVAVHNGAGVQGLADATANQLRDRGYEVTDIGNAEPRATSVIRHRADQRPNAELLAREFPTAVTLEETDEVNTVTLILGEDLAQGLGG